MWDIAAIFMLQISFAYGRLLSALLPLYGVSTQLW